MKKAAYLDSSIPSYLYDKRESIKTFIDITKDWWSEERENYRVVTSEATVKS